MKKTIFAVVIMCIMISPSFSCADAWMNNYSPYTVADVGYQGNNAIYFHIANSNNLYYYSFDQSSQNEISKSKMIFSLLLSANLTGKHIYILIPETTPTVNLTAGIWKQIKGVTISQ